jgi:hypothetical protein
MAGNGDERRAAAWERVEAKLDRLAERVGDHGELLALIDRRLARVEGDLELVKLLIEAVRHEVGRKTEKLKDELISALGRETRVELLAAQSLNNDRLDAIERRLALLEAKS